ncbi:uncharacterized protein [Prorops nasuta]|uniref:uncharacterized protein n=1 Tax=Prorops nasuta TaxID=863751 RepID=UPI0034CDA6F7
MENNYCSTILQNWNLSELNTRFTENCIDQDALQKLTPQIIKELIPEIGLRTKFLMKWQQMFPIESSNKENVILDTNKDTNLDDTLSEISDKSEENRSLRSNRPVLERQNCFVGEDMYKRLTRPNIKELLKKTSEGRIILSYYKTNKILDRKTRNILVETVISTIINDLQGRLKNSDFQQLAREIITLFPTENPDTYYIAPIPKKLSKTKKSVTARGKLVDKYRNKLRKYKVLSGETEESGTFNDASINEEELECDNVNREVEESIFWLKKNQAPWELVLKHWNTTKSFRQKKIRNSENAKINDIIEEWNILRHPNGYQLVSEDFNFLKLSVNEIDAACWNTFFKKIEKLCAIDARDKAVGNLKDLLESNLSEDCRIAIELLTLPHLVPPKGRIRIKKGQWKPSIQECKDSIILHAKNLGNINHLQEMRINALYEIGLSVQPYIIVVGATLDTLKSFYVCIDAILYKVPSMIIALDVCFKTFFAFDASYPVASEHIWLIIQRCLYKCNTVNDNKLPYIASILHHFL